MRSDERLAFLLERLDQAAREVLLILHGIEKDTFLSEIVLQRAVGMSILMASEIASQILKRHEEFIADHPDIPWEEMRGMRNRIAHNYFDIDLEKVWETAKSDIPDLIGRLETLRHRYPQGE